MTESKKSPEVYNPPNETRADRRDPIDAYLLEQARGDARVGGLMSVALKRILMRREENLSPLTELPKDAPSWAKEKWGKEEFVRFDAKKDSKLKDKVKHVADWLQASLIKYNAKDDVAATAWLDDIDQKKRPKKLLKLGSLEQAVAEADKAMRIGVMKQRQKYDGRAVAIENDPHVEIVKVFKDNKYFMVKILDVEGLDIEGANMGHCIGEGAYDEGIKNGITEIYSLRDSNNKAHATLEVTPADNKLEECKGKENKSPIEKYLPILHEFIKEKSFDLPPDTNSLRIKQWQGSYFDYSDLPEGVEFPHMLILRDLKKMNLPKKITCEGILMLNGELADPKGDLSGINTSVIYYEWLNKKGQPHREGSPAFIRRSRKTGVWLGESYFQNGLLHNDQGPAYIERDEDTNLITQTLWYKNREPYTPTNAEIEAWEMKQAQEEIFLNEKPIVKTEQSILKHKTVSVG